MPAMTSTSTVAAAVLLVLVAAASAGAARNDDSMTCGTAKLGGTAGLCQPNRSDGSPACDNGFAWASSIGLDYPCSSGYTCCMASACGARASGGRREGHCRAPQDCATIGGTSKADPACDKFGAVTPGGGGALVRPGCCVVAGDSGGADFCDTEARPDAVQRLVAEVGRCNKDTICDESSDCRKALVRVDAVLLRCGRRLSRKHAEAVTVFRDMLAEREEACRMGGYFGAGRKRRIDRERAQQTVETVRKALGEDGWTGTATEAEQELTALRRAAGSLVVKHKFAGGRDKLSIVPGIKARESVDATFTSGAEASVALGYEQRVQLGPDWLHLFGKLRGTASLKSKGFDNLADMLKALGFYVLRSVTSSLEDDLDRAISDTTTALSAAQADRRAGTATNALRTKLLDAMLKFNAAARESTDNVRQTLLSRHLSDAAWYEAATCEEAQRQLSLATLDLASAQKMRGAARDFLQVGSSLIGKWYRDVLGGEEAQAEVVARVHARMKEASEEALRDVNAFVDAVLALREPNWCKSPDQIPAKREELQRLVTAARADIQLSWTEMVRMSGVLVDLGDAIRAAVRANNERYARETQALRDTEIALTGTFTFEGGYKSGYEEGKSGHKLAPVLVQSWEAGGFAGFYVSVVARPYAQPFRGLELRGGASFGVMVGGKLSRGVAASFKASASTDGGTALFSLSLPCSLAPGEFGKVAFELGGQLAELGQAVVEHKRGGTRGALNRNAMQALGLAARDFAAKEGERLATKYFKAKAGQLVLSSTRALNLVWKYKFDWKVNGFVLDAVDASYAHTLSLAAGESAQGAGGRLGNLAAAAYSGAYTKTIGYNVWSKTS